MQYRVVNTAVVLLLTGFSKLPVVAARPSLPHRRR
eukprot:SAG11_NODE_33027_length_279_cov_1.138889_1_plen_34_part_01